MCSPRADTSLSHVHIVSGLQNFSPPTTYIPYLPEVASPGEAACQAAIASSYGNDSM